MSSPRREFDRVGRAMGSESWVKVGPRVTPPEVISCLPCVYRNQAGRILAPYS